MDQSQFTQQLLKAGYEIIGTPRTKGDLVIFKVKSNEPDDFQSSIREIKRILSPFSNFVLVNRTPTSNDPNILTVGFWINNTSQHGEEEEQQMTAENSEGRPMNEFERELVDAGHKILVPATLDDDGIVVMAVLAGVHPESIQFAIKEIKNILVLFSDSENPENIRVEPTTQEYEGKQILKIGFHLNLRLIPSFEGKDYIKEFNENQEKKRLPVNFKTHDISGAEEPTSFDQPIKFQGNVPQEPPKDDEKSFAAETITLNEVKDMVSEAVLEYMNTDTHPTETFELLPEQKAEIKQKIEEGCKRQGIMSISFHDDFDKNEATVNLLVDPTNRNNWIALKEEQIYKVSYSCKQSLYEYASEVWKNNIK